LLLEHLISLVALPPGSGCVSWLLVCIALCCSVGVLLVPVRVPAT